VSDSAVAYIGDDLPDIPVMRRAGLAVCGGLIHTRRPEAWADLTEKDAALLDILRHGAKFSELSEEGTIHKLLALLSEQGRSTTF